MLCWLGCADHCTQSTFLLWSMVIPTLKCFPVEWRQWYETLTVFLLRIVASMFCICCNGGMNESWIIVYLCMAPFFFTDKRLHPLLLVPKAQPQVQAKATDQQNSQPCKLYYKTRPPSLCLYFFFNSHDVSILSVVGWIPETLWLTDYSLWKTSHFELGKMGNKIHFTLPTAFILCNQFAS